VRVSAKVLTCDKCGGHREVRAFVSSPALARKALEALRVPFEPLKIAKGQPRREPACLALRSCPARVHLHGLASGRKSKELRVAPQHAPAAAVNLPPPRREV
jgi:hypothetical protein